MDWGNAAGTITRRCAKRVRQPERAQNERGGRGSKEAPKERGDGGSKRAQQARTRVKALIILRTHSKNFLNFLVKPKNKDHVSCL